MLKGQKVRPLAMNDTNFAHLPFSPEESPEILTLDNPSLPFPNKRGASYDLRQLIAPFYGDKFCAKHYKKCQESKVIRIRKCVIKKVCIL